jgi:hypothetical protein
MTEPVAWKVVMEQQDGSRQTVILESLKDAQNISDFGDPVPLYAAPVSVPEGWKLVPVEPTPEMLSAKTGDEYRYPAISADEYWFPDLESAHEFAADLYRAMIAAAPESPK